jgi:hypothetical protein
MEFVAQHPVEIIIGVCIMLGIVLGIMGAAVIIVMGDKITNIHGSRAGFDIYTNDIVVWSEVVDVIEQIDLDTEKSICKVTIGLTIIDPEKYSMSTESIVVNLKANLPLILAVYENHHTREISSGIDTYIENKVYAVLESVKMWKKHFPELTENEVYRYTCHWIKKLTQNLRKACITKIAYYQSQIERKDISKPLKTILENCLSKNNVYVQRIDELSERSDIAIHSSILLQQKQS